MSKNVYDYVIKFIIIGDSSVGKSNIMSQYTDKRYMSSHDSTIGVEFATKIVSVNNINYKIQIWDTAGQEMFKSITRSYYRGAVGCLLVYDITNPQSFKSIDMWLNEIRNYCDSKIVIALVGNKCDLEDNRQISYEEGNTYAKDNNILFFESSAKTGYNINICFADIVQIIQNKIEKNEIKLIKSGSSAMNITLIDDTVKNSTCSC